MGSPPTVAIGTAPLQRFQRPSWTPVPLARLGVLDTAALLPRRKEDLGVVREFNDKTRPFSIFARAGRKCAVKL